MRRSRFGAATLALLAANGLGNENVMSTDAARQGLATARDAGAAARMGSTTIDPVDSGEPADMLVLHKIRTQLDQPGNLAFVNSATGKVVARVPVGREPHEVAVSWDGKWALVTNTGANAHRGNTLSLIDIATRKEVRRVDLGPLTSPHGVTYNNGRFYFTAEGSKVVAAYDPDRDHLVWAQGTGQETTHNLVVSRNGRVIFTANRGSGTVTLMERSDIGVGQEAWRVTTIPVCKGPQGLDLSPDGQELWAGCRGSAAVAVISTAARKVVAIVPTGILQLARVRFTPDGRRVLLAGIGNGEIALWDAAARKEIRRIKLGNYAEGILVSPDGERAFIGVTTDDNVAEIDLSTMMLVRRLHTGLGPDGMAWLGKR